MKRPGPTGSEHPDVARRVVLFMLVLSVPSVAFGLWMVAIGAYGLAATWFILVVAATVGFLRLMLRALAEKDGR